MAYWALKVCTACHESGRIQCLAGAVSPSVDVLILYGDRLDCARICSWVPSIKYALPYCFGFFAIPIPLHKLG